jgi:hypothetical protein
VRPPSSPATIGASAIAHLLGDQPLTSFTHQREAENFSQGTDTRMDLPIGFADPRQFQPRRVTQYPATL